MICKHIDLRALLCDEGLVNLQVVSNRIGPARVVQWWACRTHDLVVVFIQSPVEATFLSGEFSPLTSAEACEKSSRWLWKEKLC